MFLPENIDLAHSEKYTLSIRLTPNGFSFCIFSPADPTIFHFQETNFSKNLPLIENIKKTFFEVNFFTQPFRKVVVNVVTPYYTSVPITFFDKTKISEIYAFNIHQKAGHVLSNYIEEISNHILFDLNDEVYSFLVRNLWNPVFAAQPTTLTRYFAKYKPESENEIRYFVDFHDEMVSGIAFKGNKLLTANSYDNCNRFEALYFVVNICEKLSFDQNSDKIFFSGNTEANKESVETLKKLIKNAEQIQFQPKHDVSPDQLSSIPTDILIQLCE